MSEVDVDLLLEPMDVLLFRDGRPFGVNGFASGGLPTPQTLAGALRTLAMESAGVDFQKFKLALEEKKTLVQAAEHVKPEVAWAFKHPIGGPWLSRKQTKSWERLVPAPADLMRAKEPTATGLFRILPAPPEFPGWKADESEPALRPAFDKDRAVEKERVAGFLSPGGLELWLQGQVPLASHVVAAQDLYSFDRRTGVGIDEDARTSKKGALFGVSYLALKPKVAFTARWKVSQTLAERLKLGLSMPWGGEGRQVRVSRLDSIKPWPSPTKEGCCLLLTTPALFDSGWRPQSLVGKLECFYSGGEQHISGWDLARGVPKVARLAMSAGTVFRLSAPLSAQLTQTALSDSADDRLAGWGHFLMGATR
jgi:CRISPR-associated protein Cmr3